VLASDELVTAIEVPAAARARTTVARRLALWQGAFAVTSVAVSARSPESGVVADLRIVLGGVAPTPRRIPVIEHALEGRRYDARAAARACAAWERGTHPLAGNHWKVFATSGLVRAALDELYGGAR
jgi:xanthine dehydrogenase YagS FAD-binding subunit